MIQIFKALKETLIDIGMLLVLIPIVVFPVWVALEFGENVSMVIFTPLYLIILFVSNLRRK